MESHGMADMNQICLPRIYPSNHIQGFFEIEVGMMGLVMQCIDNQIIDIPDILYDLVVEGLSIGKIRQVTKRKTENIKFSMVHGQRRDGDVSHLDLIPGMNRNQFNRRGTRIFIFSKNILKTLLDIVQNPGQTNERKIFFGDEIKRPDR